MMRKLDIQVAEALWDAFSGKHAGAAEAVLDETSLLHLPGRSGFSGQYQGGGAILELLQHMADLTDGTLRFRPSRTLTSNKHTIVRGHTSAAGRGTQLDTNTVHLLSLRGDRVCEIWIFHENQDRVDEFWACHGSKRTPKVASSPPKTASS